MNDTLALIPVFVIVGMTVLMVLLLLWWGYKSDIE